MHIPTEIQDFLNEKKLLVAGASSQEKKFGHLITKSLIEQQFNLEIVNPNAKEILGIQVYPSIQDAPDGYNNLYIVTPKSETDKIIKEAAKKGIKNIWVQQNSETVNTPDIAKELGIQLIHKKCLFMFLDPVKGIHKFHRSLAKLFGTYAKVK